MKICPMCDREFDDSAQACEADGTTLLIVRDRAAEQADAMRGRLIEGRYRVIEKLGAGGMGAVFVAEQTAVGRKVAIKVLGHEVASDKNAVRRFMQEARAASALSHPNTITIHDFGQTPEGELYLVMELVPGQTLSAVLRNSGALPPARAAHMAHQILNALQEAHGAGIIHRDLKPENVIVSPRSGNPDFLKVLDFGLAKLTEGADSANGLTQTGQVFGTPGYMAPEQAKGERCDGRADLYAVGVMLYEMLSGRRPFEGDSPLSVLVKHIQEPPPPFETLVPPVFVPPALCEVVFRTLSKDREARYPTAADMNEALMAAADDAGLASGSYAAAAVSSAMAAASSSSFPRMPSSPSVPSASAPTMQPPSGFEKTIGSGIMGQVSLDNLSVAPTPAAPRRGSGPLLAAGAVLALVVGGVALWRTGETGGGEALPAVDSSRSPAASAPPLAAPAAAPVVHEAVAQGAAAQDAAAPAAPARIEVAVESEPAGPTSSFRCLRPAGTAGGC